MMIAAGRLVVSPYNPLVTISPAQVPPSAHVDSMDRSKVPLISGNARAQDKIPYTTISFMMLIGFPPVRKMPPLLIWTKIE